MPQSAASFLPRLSLSRGDGPSLPLFNSRRSLRSKPSEYDLAELSPRPEQSLLWPEPAQDRRADRTPSPAAKMKRQVLFAGPPPPIATSTLLYRDEETRVEALPRYGGPPNHTASLGDTLRSVFLDRPPPEPPREVSSGFDADSVWRNIQRRERAIQKDLQRLLDVQAAGLSAGLGRSLDKSPSLTPSSASDAGRSTPTSTYHTPRSQFHSTESSMRMSRQGDVIPVRQPRSKPMGLRSARAALARNMALLADLKVEEDANLADALSTRKRALAQLRKMSVRRDGIADKLRALENADDDPLTRDLALLNDEHRSVSTEISELEAKLAGLHNRKRVLEEQIEDLSNQRESGLSGYRGALKEAEEHVAATLTRPPVRPLDLEVFGRGADGAEINGADDAALSGAEFMRLRPTRRTIAMAREWWEGEVRILEQRKAAVDQERAALEDGAGVWRDCVKLVTDFESSLRRQMKQQSTSSEDSDEAADSPEQRMRGQLSDMGAVIKSLDLHLVAAENKGWNLLICAIGAELEAFKEAEGMFREALREAGYSGGPDEEDRTPRLGRSASEIKADRDAMGSQHLVDTRDDGDDDDPGAESSDNEVPADLLVSHHDPRGGGARHDSMSSDAAATDTDAHDRGEHSENEVPPEFLAEHHHDD